MTDYVFGYGALLDHRAFGVGDAARLDGYRLSFSGFATVQPCEDAHVYGALLPVDMERLARFDAMEGFGGFGEPRNYYDRVRVTTRTLFYDDQVRAWVYVMRDPRPYPPHVGYLDGMESGYRFYDLPLDALHDAVEATLDLIGIPR